MLLRASPPIVAARPSMRIGMLTTVVLTAVIFMSPSARIRWRPGKETPNVVGRRAGVPGLGSAAQVYLDAEASLFGLLVHVAGQRNISHTTARDAEQGCIGGPIPCR